MGKLRNFAHCYLYFVSMCSCWLL